jgi:hypothetical protein
LIGTNRPFETITDSYAGDLGSLGGDLPFRVARFVTHSCGIHLDLLRLSGDQDDAQAKATLSREIIPLWGKTRSLGIGLVEDLQTAAGRSMTQQRRR